MCSETDHTFSSTMSNSDQLFLVREGQEDIGSFEVAERSIFKFESERHHESVSSNSETQSRAQEEEKRKEEEEEEDDESCDDRIESKEEKLKVKEEEEEDGFRTPTSLDHRIPEAKQCPSAPTKPKPSLKRKPNSQSYCSFRSCRRNPLDLSKEVELFLFPPSDSHQNKKKSRR